jgi:hypothetical protein
LAQRTQSDLGHQALDPRKDILWRCFFGRIDAFAVENRHEGGWTAVRKDVPKYLLHNHLNGKTTVATYPVSAAGHGQWVCFDVDEKGEAAKRFLLWLHQWFTERQILFLIEDTGGRGYHGWGLFLCWVAAGKAMALASSALSDYNSNMVGALPCSVEVFPKQAKPANLGNPVRLPWGRHQSGNWSHFLSLDFDPDDEGAMKLIHQGKRTTELDLDAMLPQLAPSKLKKLLLVQPDERWAEVIPEGRRHNTLLSLAGELKAKKFSSEQILAEMRIHNAQRCSPPLPDKEVEEIAKAIAMKGNGKQPDVVKKHLLARFPGLVDIVDNDGSVKYLMLNEDDRTAVIAEISRDTVAFMPPSKEHLPFSLPRAQDVLKYIDSDDEHKLFNDLVTYFHKAAQLPAEMHYKMISWWVLHTYLYDKFTYSPMLALVGMPERGKTRLGRAAISVAYRGLETETLREANLFRWSQDLGAAIFLDVKDIWRKAEREKSEDILLKRYEKGGKVGRVLYPEKGPFRDTVYFDTYGPTIIATNESIHHILDTRCLPIILPDAGQKVWPDLDFRESLALKERLVAFRARRMTRVLPEYPKPPLGRLGDILQPLGVIMRLVSPEEEQIFQELTKLLWLERLEDKAQSKEARLISALDQSSGESDRVTVSEVAKAYNEGLELKQQLSPESIGRRLRTLGFKGVKQPGGTRVIIVEQQLLATLKLRWGLELPEDAPEHPQKTAQTAQLPTQLQPQIQKPTGGSRAEPPSKPPVEPPNSSQIQAGSLGSSVGGGGDAEVDYFLPDSTPISCRELIRQWTKLGKPQLEVKPGDIVADLESFLSDDVDLEYLALVVQVLTQEAGAQMEQDNVSQTLGMTIEQALDIWTRRGKPVIHLGPGENCFGLDKLLSHSDINPRHLSAVRDWLQMHKIQSEGLPPCQGAESGK